MNVIRVALPGYNALTDTNVDHFALYSDQDNVLIKELLRSNITIANGVNRDINHDLGYIPFVIVFYETSTGVWRKLIGNDEFSGDNTYFSVTTTIIRISNFSGSSKNYKYYIFYDQIV